MGGSYSFPWGSSKTLGGDRNKRDRKKRRLFYYFQPKIIKNYVMMSFLEPLLGKNIINTKFCLWHLLDIFTRETRDHGLLRGH